MKNILVLLVIFFFLTDGITFAQNRLSKKEKRKGWQLLFDGETTSGWRNFNSNTIGSAWKVENGVLFLDNTVTTREDRGDIVTHETFEDFELSFDWRIDSCGNSGIFFHVVEGPEYKYVWQTGPEMQLLDNACHAEGKIETHRSGDLYDLIASRQISKVSAGQWNHAKIISKKGDTRFFLNGDEILSFNVNSKEWQSLVQKSKFSQMNGFAKSTKGHIALQDHGDRVWFRNIKIRRLN